ncbi:MAG TPA: lytic transglycosylase domain-containing protein [Paracoccus solventivorans]|uniref:Lytic transglycosylase domain-containing protein n=1 Tax=Paracoccus solventivorans TaxID=53463 RepID=A0A832PM41_9RHOB|nr:lytic transglycosylase domain-containing protein [Paracoccus solventivorans]HHW33492.1 lytic transglycosylase domain-containing protein [Paracoccus solventivorans]
MDRTRFRLAVLALAVAGVTAPLSGARAEDGAAVARALAAAGAQDWVAAEASARQSGALALDLVAWQRLRAGQGVWAEYLDFARRNPDWPGMELLYRRGEAALPPDAPAAEVLAWFGARLPETVPAAQAWIAAQPRKQRAAAAVRFWTQPLPLDEIAEAAFLAAQGKAVTPHHAARLAALLDAGEWAAAERMLPRIPPGPDADLARARIAVQARRPGVDALILALPQPQRDDAGLALDRFRWRVAAKQGDLARALMLERSTSAEALRDPAAWAGARRDHARAALRAGDWALAERLAVNHFLPEGHADAVDLDWLAGYAALRAGAADRAAAHFARLPVEGRSGITLSRSHYWQGRAAEAQGDRAAATAAYARAAAHQATYYGQLAAERIGAAMDPALVLAGAETLPDWRGSALLGNRLFQAGLWLLAAGDGAQAQRFFLHLAQTAEPQDILRMGRLMAEMHRPWDALRLSKAAAAKGLLHPALHYPLTGLERGSFGLPPELVMAIARQESEFNHTVMSRVGARGLMQVMPDTARQMAGEIGEAFELPRLTRDAAYNARLGAAYLAGLRNRFGNSIALVAAGYNAGPGRSSRWLRDFGDLRAEGGPDPVDWVEMIPFDETRNYVMRVAEALPIYRARIAGHSVPFVPSWDLSGGVSAPQVHQGPLGLAQSAPPRPAPDWVTGAFAQAVQLALNGDAAGIARLVEAAGTPDEAAPRPGPQIAAIARAIGPPAITASTAPPSRPVRAGEGEAAAGAVGAVADVAAAGTAAGAATAVPAGEDAVPAAAGVEPAEPAAAEAEAATPDAAGTAAGVETAVTAGVEPATAGAEATAAGIAAVRMGPAAAGTAATAIAEVETAAPDAAGAETAGAEPTTAGAETTAAGGAAARVGAAAAGTPAATATPSSAALPTIAPPAEAHSPAAPLRRDGILPVPDPLSPAEAARASGALATR